MAETVKNQETLERELRPLKKLKDKYPCVLITLDNDFNQDYDGIKSINAIDFFTGKGVDVISFCRHL